MFELPALTLLVLFADFQAKAYDQWTMAHKRFHRFRYLVTGLVCVRTRKHKSGCLCGSLQPRVRSFVRGFTVPQFLVRSYNRSPWSGKLTFLCKHQLKTLETIFRCAMSVSPKP